MTLSRLSQDASKGRERRLMEREREREKREAKKVAAARWLRESGDPLAALRKFLASQAEASGLRAGRHL